MFPKTHRREDGGVVEVTGECRHHLSVVGILLVIFHNNLE